MLEPSLAKREKAAAPEPGGRRRAMLPRATARQAMRYYVTYVYILRSLEYLDRYYVGAFAREAREGCRAGARRAKAGHVAASYGSASHEVLRDVRVYPPKPRIPRSILCWSLRSRSERRLPRRSPEGEGGPCCRELRLGKP